VSRQAQLVIAGVALGVAALAAVAMLLIGTHRQASSSATGTSPVAVGEAVFQSGVGPDGASIPRTASQGGGMMGGGMMNAGCASCHDTNGHGRSTQQFTSPNITYSNLTDPKGMLMPDGTRGPTYTDATIRTAVTTGVDPTGAHLEAPMPQWQITGQEWNGLLAYLKTLH
jgi:cytochrome c oxidase subunit 2